MSQLWDGDLSLSRSAPRIDDRVFGRHVVGHLYSDDPFIVALSSKIAAIVGVGYCLLSLFYAAMATLSAQGRPGWVAGAFFVGAWVVCVPLAWVLTFDTPSVDDATPLVGLWFAMSTGYLVVTAVAWVGVWRTDWDEVARAARERSEARGVADNGEAEALLNPAAAAGDGLGPAYGSVGIDESAAAAAVM